MNLVVTGSCGLVGSSVVEHFCNLGWNVYGVDNNSREAFFGQKGSVIKTKHKLLSKFQKFTFYNYDIRNQGLIRAIIRRHQPDLLVHAAAQPSHDFAAKDPQLDFSINATATFKILEAVRTTSRHTVVVYLSTNKVYGDRPNIIPMVEKETRYDYLKPEYYDGISEDFPIDQSKHSLFGASKLSGDLVVQEYGRYFDMQTCCLRCGCITGANHAGVELHGFLSYLTRCANTGRFYVIYGYKGKQVRDNIHASDVARFIECFYERPGNGAVYNLGGGRENSCSVLEAITEAEKRTGQEMRYEYDSNERAGDHICYITNLSKAKRDYPSWNITVSLDQIFEELCHEKSSR